MNLSLEEIESIIMWNGCTVAEFGENTPWEDELMDRLRAERDRLAAQND